MAAAVDQSNRELTYLDVDRTAQRVMAPAGLKYWLWVAFCAFLVVVAGSFWTRQIYEGLGVTGYGQPTLWAVYITDFVFWVGIAHSGTLILAMGLIPDIANQRDVATGWRKKFYTVLSCGWQGSDLQWRNFSMAYLLLAGFATPLVLSVHSVVSWDFATMQTPGMHSTIFAPYFVAGAIFSGCALVLTLIIPMRKMLHIEDLVTIWHLDNLSKVVLLTSLIITYSYTT